jgi:Fur family peroxide stress response transcriptional regulator
MNRRRSKKREAILELIQSSLMHPSALWVYERLKPQWPDLSLGTVYRNIKILVGEGALASAGVVNGEERFDGITVPHPHAVCKKCDFIVDLDEEKEFGNGAFPAISIPGFLADVRNTVFYGECVQCTETTALGR